MFTVFSLLLMRCNPLSCHGWIAVLNTTSFKEVTLYRFIPDISNYFFLTFLILLYTQSQDTHTKKQKTASFNNHCWHKMQSPSVPASYPRAQVGLPQCWQAKTLTCLGLYCLVGSCIHKHKPSTTKIFSIVGEVEQWSIIKGAISHLGVSQHYQLCLYKHYIHIMN